MSFVSAVGVPASPPASDVIRNDGWFPDLSIQHLRATVRLDGTITEPRLRDAVRYAIASVNIQLRPYRARFTTASFVETSTDQIDGESRLLMLYRRAVYCATKAELMERFRDITTTQVGSDRAERWKDDLDEMRRDVNWCICDILGKSHTAVELI